MTTKEYTLSYPWDENGYKPYVNFQLSISEGAFHLHIVAHEKNPKRDETEHLHYVHRDSCVEWFVIFAPEHNNKYINFELNANGVLYAAFGKDRFTRTLLDLDDVKSMNIQSNLGEESWMIDFDVPFTLIQKYVPEFQYNEEGTTILSNFYKCGDGTEFPHYGIWNPVELPKPDFHRPEFFGKVTI